ncbi:MAG: tRNA (guanosine(46)-N7)-methyltransferase TrmB [Campylobacteraceae bacterium]|nr:tRNA (guanosine(46)-N7)-methyltransferase TrmB [Campylobacteraceae bacterium]
MPNFQTSALDKLDYPLTQGEAVFEFESSSSRGNKLIMTTLQEERFVLKISQKENGRYLVKGDKITRPARVSFLQKALINFRNASNAVEICSNIEPKNPLHVRTSPYLKGVEFFANDFETQDEIWIEIGFGSGRHLLHQAKKNPNIQFIGLEIHKPSIEQVLRQCELQGITNILVVDYDARLFLEFVASNSVGKIFVHFPVPWDKKPHRRVFSQSFIEESLRVLNLGGQLELRTDSQNYFEFSFAQMMCLAKASVHVKKNKDLDIISKYEDRWRRMEKDIYDVTLTNEISSPPISKVGKLKFSQSVDFKEVCERFTEEIFRGDGFFVHLEELFVVSATSGLIRVSFGANERNEKSYIWINEGNVSYFPDNVLATKNNVDADKIIKKWIYGTCN